MQGHCGYILHYGVEEHSLYSARGAQSAPRIGTDGKPSMIGRNRNEVTREVMQLIAEIMAVSVEDLHGDTRVVEDLNASSMDILTLVMALDAAFSTEIHLGDIPPSNVSVNWIADYVYSGMSH